MSDHGFALPELLQRAVRAGSAPAAVAGWRETATGKIAVVSSGHSRVFPERVEATPETWFDLASLTKPLVTTTLALLAFRSGVITSSTRVGEVLSEVRGSDIGELEVQQLLSHTGGLPTWLPLYCLAEGRPDRLVSSLREVRLEARPGTQVIYSCIGFVVLGLMLARIAGEELDRLFRREVLEVVGLEDQLGFNVEYATHSLCAGAEQPVVELRMVRTLGFDVRRIPAIGRGLADDGNARFLGGVAGNAGLFGTARGVVALASEFLPKGGSLLSDEERALATALHTVGLEQGRGFGWQLGSTPGCSAGAALSDAAFGHSGFTGVSVWCEPETQQCCAMLTNRNHPSQRGNDLHPLRRRFHAVISQGGDGSERP